MLEVDTHHLTLDCSQAGKVDAQSPWALPEQEQRPGACYAREQLTPGDEDPAVLNRASALAYRGRWRDRQQYRARPGTQGCLCRRGAVQRRTQPAWR
jgi:hypothetical protein